MSLMLAATGLGIGSGQTGVADQDLARDLLELPEDKFCAYLISVGYPADRPLTLIRRPDRRPFSEVVHRETWLSPGSRVGWALGNVHLAVARDVSCVAFRLIVRY
jgi:hypothetical protein